MKPIMATVALAAGLAWGQWTNPPTPSDAIPGPPSASYTAHMANTNNPHVVTANQLGLGSATSQIAALQTATNTLNQSIQTLQTATNTLNSATQALQTQISSWTTSAGTNEPLWTAASGGVVYASNAHWTNWTANEAALLALPADVLKTLTNYTHVPSGTNWLDVDVAARGLRGCVTNAGGTGSADASGWSGYAATQDVDLASFTITNVQTLALATLAASPSVGAANDLTIRGGAPFGGYSGPGGNLILESLIGNPSLGRGGYGWVIFSNYWADLNDGEVSNVAAVVFSDGTRQTTASATGTPLYAESDTLGSVIARGNDAGKVAITNLGDLYMNPSVGPAAHLEAWTDGSLHLNAADGGGDPDSPIWYKGNDGAGSGLDADLLDGLSSTAFATGTPIYADSLAPYISGATASNEFVGKSATQALVAPFIEGAAVSNAFVAKVDTNGLVAPFITGAAVSGNFARINSTTETQAIPHVESTSIVLGGERRTAWPTASTPMKVDKITIVTNAAGVARVADWIADNVVLSELRWAKLDILGSYGMSDGLAYYHDDEAGVTAAWATNAVYDSATNGWRNWNTNWSISGGSSGGSNNGAIANGPNWVTGYRGSYAISNVDAGVDSVYGYVPWTESLWTPTGITICAWVKYSNLDSYERTLGDLYNDEGYKGWELQVNSDGSIQFEVCSGGIWQVKSAASAIVAGEWYHIAGTFQVGSLLVYTNGVDVSSAYAGTEQSGVDGCSPSRYMGFGTHNGTVGDVVMDDVRMFNRALSAAEIASIVTNGTVSEGLIGQWEFEEGTGTNFADSVGGGGGAWTTNYGGTACVFTVHSPGKILDIIPSAYRLDVTAQGIGSNLPNDALVLKTSRNGGTNWSASVAQAISYFGSSNSARYTVTGEYANAACSNVMVGVDATNGVPPKLRVTGWVLGVNE